MTFREKLVRLRKIKGVTQDELACAVGVSRQAVYKWESGQSYPEALKLVEIKNLLSISIDDLLDDNYEVVMPEKKKRRRKKVEEPVAEVAAEAAPVEEAPVVEAPVVEAPKPEKKAEPAPKVEAPKAEEPKPEKKAAPKKAPQKKAEPEKTEATKRVSLFDKLFGNK